MCRCKAEWAGSRESHFSIIGKSQLLAILHHISLLFDSVARRFCGGILTANAKHCQIHDISLFTSPTFRRCLTLVTRHSLRRTKQKQKTKIILTTTANNWFYYYILACASRPHHQQMPKSRNRTSVYTYSMHTRISEHRTFTRPRREEKKKSQNIHSWRRARSKSLSNYTPQETPQTNTSK